MFKLYLLAAITLLLSGCVTSYYHSWKYRCYESVAVADNDLPPMPNCCDNNKTLGGIDSDNDGVRDDIQRYIAALDFEHPFFKRGLKQYAQSLRSALLEHELVDNAQANFTRINLAHDCALSAVLPPPVLYFKKYDIRTEVKDLHLNTFKRRFTYQKWLSNIETQLVPSVDPEVACDFDITHYEGERWR